MMETKRRREQRSMLPVHPDAAAIDIGATVHVAAVGPARDPEPVRSFGTFTGDLHRLADWFAQRNQSKKRTKKPPGGTPIPVPASRRPTTAASWKPTGHSMPRPLLFFVNCPVTFGPA